MVCVPKTVPPVVTSVETSEETSTFWHPHLVRAGVVLAHSSQEVVVHLVVRCQTCVPGRQLYIEQRFSDSSRSSSGHQCRYELNCPGR